MTHAQQTQYRKLRARVVSTYKAMQDNTDKAKQQGLNNAWVKATDKADAYLMAND